MLLRNNSTYSLLLWFLLLFTACENHTLYHSYRSVPSEGWNRCDTLCFPVSLTDSGYRVKLSVEIRHSEDYPYTNLFLFINGDTVEYKLADTDGKWNGIGLNAIYQNKFDYKNLDIKHPDTLQIRVSHGMTDRLLPGILNVGICAERLTRPEPHQSEER